MGSPPCSLLLPTLGSGLGGGLFLLPTCFLCIFFLSRGLGLSWEAAFVGFLRAGRSWGPRGWPEYD